MNLLDLRRWKVIDGLVWPFVVEPVQTTPYGYLGQHQRSGETPGGLTLMGARLYNPTTGRFLSRDPIPGGNDNPYTYPADPINQQDLTGQLNYKFTWIRKFGIVDGARKLNGFGGEK